MSAKSHCSTVAQEHNLIASKAKNRSWHMLQCYLDKWPKYCTLVSNDLKEVLALSDHMCQTLSGGKILIQVLLVRPASGVLPLD